MKPDRDSLNPEGIAVNQPRVARNELPWGKRPTIPSTLKGLRQIDRMTGLRHCAMLQDLGLRFNPYRVDDVVSRYPRVARSSQPWAERWNPVGILIRQRWAERWNPVGILIRQRKIRG